MAKGGVVQRMGYTLLLSHPLNHATPSYGGRKDGFAERVERSIAAGDSANTKYWSLYNHTGTHVDAPLHFIADGKSITDYEPSFWLCRDVAVVEIVLDQGRLIGTRDIPLTPSIHGADCLLIKTGFQKYRAEPKYYEDAPGLSPDLCAKLKSECPRLKLIGFDFISVSRAKEREKGREAHRTLLSKESGREPLLPIEDMDLSGINAAMRIKGICVAPLLVSGADGAPVTVFAELA